MRHDWQDLASLQECTHSVTDLWFCWIHPRQEYLESGWKLGIVNGPWGHFPLGMELEHIRTDLLPHTGWHIVHISIKMHTRFTSKKMTKSLCDGGRGCPTSPTGSIPFWNLRVAGRWNSLEDQRITSALWFTLPWGTWIPAIFTGNKAWGIWSGNTSRAQVEPLMLVPYPSKACDQYFVRICQIYSVSIFMTIWVSM